MPNPSNPNAHRRAWLWNLYVVIVTVVTGLFLAWLSNKLLIDEVVKRAMSRIHAPLLSLSYPQTGQRAITVVTIDDADLKEYGLNWPVPLDYYQRLVDRVIKQKPKAVFLDVLFLDDKPAREIDSLIGAACRATDAGVPFYLATFAREPLSSNAERRIFDARTSAGIPCAIAVRSNVTPDSLDQAQWAYPLRPRTEDELDGPVNLPDSVALTIYCRLYAATCPTRTEVPLSLIWATKAAPTNVQTMVARDPQGTLTPICRSVWNWWEVLPGASLLFTLAGHPALPLCPYNQVIPVRALKGQGFSPEELHDALNGKIVMVGADLKAIGDNSFSPVHGRLPGVLVHAMALDNLISFEGEYRENGDFEWHELWHAPANVFIFLSVLLTTSVMVLWKRQKERFSSEGMSTEITGREFFSQWWIVRKLHHIRDVKHSPSRLITALVSCSLMGIKIFVRLTMVVMLPLLLILGLPRFGSTQKSRNDFWQSLLGFPIYIALCASVFYLGYYVFHQGPLSIIEYVLFPLMAHFLHVGETIANRSIQFWYAMRASNPWAEWARQGVEAENKH
jgi:hypothetical protein